MEHQVQSIVEELRKLNANLVNLTKAVSLLNIETKPVVKEMHYESDIRSEVQRKIDEARKLAERQISNANGFHKMI